MAHDRSLATTGMRRGCCKTGAQRMPSEIFWDSSGGRVARIMDAIALAVRFDPMLPCRSMLRKDCPIVSAHGEPFAQGAHRTRFHLGAERDRDASPRNL